MDMNTKERRDQTMDKLAVDDLNHTSAVLAGGFEIEDNTIIPDESAAPTDEVAVKVGRKRAYHETEDPNSSLSENNKDLSNTKQPTIAASDIERSTMESDSKPSSYSHQENNWLESARAELGEVREENERLKKNLSKMMKEYEALRMQVFQAMKQEETKKPIEEEEEEEEEEVETPDDLVSLSLGRFSESKKNKSSFSQEMKEGERKANKRELSLALECKFEASESDAIEANRSRTNSFEEANKKNLSSRQNGEDEVVQQNPMKKARVCVRARCDTPTMNDGCQWRKYGQKIAKGNPCPRAYYRCTIAPSCPVRKQVQRCAEDMSILVTTYEGVHNHPLPLSATAMASTTSAAASMLLSGSSSSTSRANGLTPSAVIRTSPADLHNLNVYLSDNSNSKQFYLHNSTLSPGPSHPTITIDLTNSAQSSSHFNRFSSSSYSTVPKFVPSTLNFGSTSIEPNWSNGYFGYRNTTATNTTTSSSHPFNRNSTFQHYMKNNPTPNIPYQQDSSTIAAATKAITADPSFQSALAAALSSIIGNNSADNSGQKLKWGEHFPVASGGYCPPTPPKSNACATSYLNKTTDLQLGSLMVLPTSLPFASPMRNASSSPGDNKDHDM